MFYIGNLIVLLKTDRPHCVKCIREYPGFDYYQMQHFIIRTGPSSPEGTGSGFVSLFLL